jgi:hypothetical protein
MLSGGPECPLEAATQAQGNLILDKHRQGRARQRVSEENPSIKQRVPLRTAPPGARGLPRIQWSWDGFRKLCGAGEGSGFSLKPPHIIFNPPEPEIHRVSGNSLREMPEDRPQQSSHCRTSVCSSWPRNSCFPISASANPGPHQPAGTPLPPKPCRVCSLVSPGWSGGEEGVGEMVLGAVAVGRGRERAALLWKREEKGLEDRGRSTKSGTWAQICLHHYVTWAPGLPTRACHYGPRCAASMPWGQAVGCRSTVSAEVLLYLTLLVILTRKLTPL